ncbi:hypothetical protein [Mucilaginibacter sp. dw_454]|uniref:hypothetical protein n=1 Tax=Mucilaginibacter sp. dw_454 TaxID=2720079 RepID=UPI001BD53A5B|nr:hypothetical protein [Mucilaginibacter sp. dw_454]
MENSNNSKIEVNNQIIECHNLDQIKIQFPEGNFKFSLKLLLELLVDKFSGAKSATYHEDLIPD